MNLIEQDLEKNMQKNNIVLEFASRYREELDYSQVDLSIYELEKIIEEADSYSCEQLIKILTNENNMLRLLEANSFVHNFIKILNLNIELITKCYLNNDYQEKIRNKSRLDQIFAGIAYLYPLNHNKPAFFSIEDNLEEIGATTRDEYYYIKNNGYKDDDFKYSAFFRCINELKDEDTIFQIIEFFLEKNYLKAFQLSSKGLDKNLLSKYYESNQALITKVVNEGDLRLIDNIFKNLDKEQLKREITKDRERIIYALDWQEFDDIFIFNLENSYSINMDSLDIDKFVSTFQGDSYYLRCGKFNNFLADDVRVRIIKKVKDHDNIMKEILKKLGDTDDEFLTYLRIINHSSFKDSLMERELVFFNDLKTVLLEKDYKKALEFNYKYQNIDILKLKLQILEKIKEMSRRDIISSLTDLSEYRREIQTYKLGTKTYRIPTIVFDGEPYNFLIRREKNGKQRKISNLEGEFCYSTIYEENRSTFYGDTGIIFGYSKINPMDITYIYPFDAITNNSSETKYYQNGLKMPLWLSAKDLNRITKNNRCYNELRINGFYEANFVVSYDEANDMTIDYAGNNETLLVKILRKSYPNSIEENKDPYHNWQ